MDKRKMLEFGCGISQDEVSRAVCAFGARGILKPEFIDIPHDRCSNFGSREDLEELRPFITKFILTCEQRRWAQKELFRMVEGDFVGEASPQNSHGYLYISVWKAGA